MSVDPWGERPSVERCARLTRQVLASNQLHEDAPAILVHDLDLLDARLSSLRALLPPGTLHAIAIKANPIVALLRRLALAGFGLEAASFEEVSLALAAGCPPARIVYDGPAKTRHEIEEALRLGVYLNADHFDEIERIAANNPTGRVGLRINPEVGAGIIASTSVGTRQGRFGVSLHDDHDTILAYFARYPWLDGLHMHVGSQGMALELLVEAVSRLVSLAQQIPRRLTLDIGGGLPTTYLERAPAPGLRVWWDRVSAISGLDRYPLVTELGRALHANTAVAISRVERVRPGRQAILHLGADLLLRTTYRPDDWPHEFIVLDPEGAPKLGPLAPQTLLGPLCFAGDVLARGVMLPEITPGDLVVIRDVGAYTMSMWSRHCSRTMPAVVGVAGESIELLRRRETPMDIVSFWS